MKLPETEKDHFLWVLRFAQSAKKRGAKKGQKAPLLREIARSRHTGTGRCRLAGGVGQGAAILALGKYKVFPGGIYGVKLAP